MTTPESNREVVLRRDVPFPRALVWKAITDPDHMKQWWGPDGFTIENLSLDLRVGGTWIFDMIGPDGTRYPNHSVFTEVVAPSRLAFDHGDGQRIWFIATILLDETAAGTMVTLRHIFPSREARESRRPPQPPQVPVTCRVLATTCAGATRHNRMIFHRSGAPKTSAERQIPPDLNSEPFSHSEHASTLT